MLGYFKFAILAFLVLNVSATIKAESESTLSNIGREELLVAEIKALMALKQVEEAAILNSGVLTCKPRGAPCSPNLIRQECCSKKCGVNPFGPPMGFTCG